MSDSSVSVWSRPDVSETFRPVSPDSCLLSGPRRTPSGPRDRSNTHRRVVPSPPLRGLGPLRVLRKINTLNRTGQVVTDKTGQTLSLAGSERARTAAQSPVTASTRPATLADTPQALSVDLRAAQ